MSARRVSLLTTFTLTAMALLSPAAAWAQGRLHDDPQLAAMSDAIVTGRVARLGYGRDPRASFIYTYVTIEVSERIKGAGIGNELVVKQLGGRLGDLGMMVYDQATFRVGEEVLLFLTERPRDGTLQTTGLWQGKWTISRNASAGDTWAVRTPFGDGERRNLVAPERFDDTRPLEPFLAELRNWSGPQERVVAPMRTLNTHPAEMSAVVSSDIDVAPAFTFLGPARWNQADSFIPVLVDIQAGGEPGLAGGGFSEIATARNIWNNAGSSMALAPGVTGVLDGASKDAVCNSANRGGTGRLTVYFEDPCDEISGDTLAVGGFFFLSSGGVTINGTRFDRITAGFLIFSDDGEVQDALDTSACFRDVSIHEIGHTIGLGHTTVPGSIMLPFLDNACYSEAGQASAALSGGLGSDDIAAINFIYPLPGTLTTDPTVAPGAPRALTYTLTEDRIILEWLPPNTGGPVLSYQIQGGNAPGKLNYVNFDTFQNATKINLKIKDGEYFIRVRARNGAGSSISTSNEVNFVVQGNPDEPNPVFVPPTLNYAQDANGNMLVTGEIQNRFVGPGPPTFIRVQATFLRADGSTVGSASSYLLGRSRRLRDTGVVTDTALAAGQRGCFMITSNVPASQVADVELSGSYSIFSNDPLDGRLRVAQYGQGPSDDGTLQMSGTATNVGSRRTYFNKVVFDVKTPQVQTCDFAFVSGSTITLPGGGTTSTALQPGASGAFQNTTFVPFGALEVRTYTQWDEAAPAGSGSALQALMRRDAAAAGSLAALQQDRSLLWQLLSSAAPPDRQYLHRLRNDIEARLQGLESRLAPAGTVWTLPFTETLRIPVRVPQR